MRPLISLSEAMCDRHLLGEAFLSSSFWTWKTVAKVLDGEPLREPAEIDLFQRCTGRSLLLNKPVHRLFVLAGRRAGKDRFMSAVAVWRAALCAEWREHISAGEHAVVMLLGADREQAAILRRYCDGLLRAPLLAHEIRRHTGKVIQFRNGASLEITTNDFRLVRGRSAIAVIGSECAHWRTDEHAASCDEEVINAAEPSMAMCPDGGLLLLASSVFRKQGYMFRKYKELHGNDDSGDICWFAPSRLMNPVLKKEVIDRAMAEDPAAAEYLNKWREDVDDFIPYDVIESCCDFGVLERSPQTSFTWPIAIRRAARAPTRTRWQLHIASTIAMMRSALTYCASASRASSLPQ